MNRRDFVRTLAAAGASAALATRRLSAAWAQSAPRSPQILSGTHFDLTLHELPVDFTGHRALATAVNGSVPGPTLRWREGDTVTLAVTNRLKKSSSIHWHGVRVPAGMDGVPGLSFPGIEPGETFVYRFPVRQNGTYWYHSHTRFQEQTGLLGAIVIDPKDRDPVPFDREYVVVLTDWTDTNPETVFSNLKEDSEYYNDHQRTAGTFIADVRKQGLFHTIADRLMWARMNMTPTDFADVTGATYTYLLNGNPAQANWTALFQPGEVVRLRFINASSMTFFDVRIPHLPMTVVQSDGNDVEPVTVDEFRMGVAETYDVLVRPQPNQAYTIFAQSMDRSGYARGTLAPRAGMSAAVPPMDPRPLRTMVDMGMAMGAMGGMNMAGIDGMTADDMKGMPGMKMPAKPGMAMTAMPGMAMHGGAPSSPSSPADSMSPMNPMRSIRENRAGAKGAPGPVERQAGGVAQPRQAPRQLTTNRQGTIPFPQPGPGVMPIVDEPAGGYGSIKLRPSNPVHMHIGPEVDMVPQHITERLDSPGDGLDGNGRRVLTYADLRARYRGADGRPPTREIELHLSGNMERYIWGFNGEKFSQAKPIAMRLGERLRIVLVNDTMMEHPIHLHGLWSELENGHGPFNPYKHTIIVKPSERVSYLVSADTPGEWAYHCHLLYHMEAGMFRTVVVS